MHYSVREAVAFLRALRRHGFEASGGELTCGDGYGYMHPNVSAACVRRWAEDLGLPDPKTAVVWRREGLNERGKLIGRYVVRQDLRELIRYGLLAHPDMPQWAFQARTRARARTGGQAALFT